MFRNFGHILGPYSDLVVACQWTQGVALSIKFSWYDPDDRLVFTQSATVQTTWIVSFHRPTLQRPIRPGVWKVTAEVNGQKVAESLFLIHPVSIKDKKEITDSGVSAEVNSDLRRLVNDPEDKEMDMLDRGKFVQDRQVLIGRTGEELHRWIDGLVSGYWKLRGFCAVAPMVQCNSVPVCKNEKWSTYHPDPKSELGDIKQNGRLR